MKYVLSGEGATSIFTIDENTGDIHATKRLDREAQAYYTLQAQAVDRLTNLPVEPRSEFVVKVQDINDNEPKFAEGPYLAGVPEMSPLGKRTCPTCPLSETVLVRLVPRQMSSGLNCSPSAGLLFIYRLFYLLFIANTRHRGLLLHQGAFHSGGVQKTMMWNE